MSGEKVGTIDWNAPIAAGDAARLVGITPARLRQLFASGHVERLAHGKTTAAAVAQGYAKFWQEKASEKTKGSATSRVSDARAAEIEQRMAVRDRVLVPSEDATAAIDHVVAACAEAFAALPAMITPPALSVGKHTVQRDRHVDIKHPIIVDTKRSQHVALDPRK